MNHKKHRLFDYELTQDGKLAWFDYIFEEFEMYIQNYFNKSSKSNDLLSKKDWRNKLSNAFKIKYVEEKFSEDFIQEEERLMMAPDGENKLYDITRINQFKILHTVDNLNALAEEVHSAEVDDENFYWINVETLTEWCFHYYNEKAYRDCILNGLSCLTGIDIDDILVDSFYVS